MLQLLRSNGKFARMLTASLISEMGSYFTYMLLIIMAYEKHGSMMSAMGIAIASSLGSLVMGSVSGVLVERKSPVQVMVVIHLLQAALIASLFWLPVHLWVYYGAAALMAVLRTFFTPASRKYQVQVISDDDLMEANAAMQMTRESLKIIGPLIAVFTLSLLPKDLQGVGYLIDASTFLLAALLLAGLRSKPEEKAEQEAAEAEAQAKEKPSFRQQWVEGFEPLKHPIVGTVVAMFLLIIMGIGGADVIFTAHVSSQGHSSLWVGYVFASLSAGLILTSVLGARYIKKWPLSLRLGGATLLIGLCELGIGASSGMAGMLMAAFVLGVFNSVYNMSATTYMQRTVPREKLGRFFGLISSVFSAMTLFGIAVNGMIGDWLSPQAALFWSGGVLAVCGLISIVTISLAERKLEANKSEEVGAWTTRKT